MKNHRLYLFICLCVSILTSISCSQGKDEFRAVTDGQESVLVKVPIHVGQLPMETNHASSDTRSTMPMGPEQENPMRTLAVVQFDNEGNLLEINPNNAHPYYHFIDLTSSDNLSGVISTDLNNISLFSSEERDTRVCLIANKTETEIGALLWDEEANRNLLWNEFRLQTIEIPYKLPEKGNDVDSLGHVNEIYMYGHYEGTLSMNGDSPEVGNAKPLSISMARIIARVEMNIKLAENVNIPDGYHVFFGMYNVEQSAYLVPGAANYLTDNLIHNHITFDPVDRTEGLSQVAKTFYFYMAPHIVLNTRNNATYFAIWCVKEGVSAEDLQKDKDEAENSGRTPNYPYAQILICNDPLMDEEKPSVEGAYWINRNSIYHVNLTLTYTDNAASTRCLAGREYEINLNRLIH